MRGRVPRYVEKAMLRLMDEPDLIGKVYGLMPYVAYFVGIRLVNSDVLANYERVRAAQLRGRKRLRNLPKP